MATLVKRGNSYRIMVPNGYDTNGKKIMETTTYHPDESLSEKQQKKALDKFVIEFEDKVKNGNILTGDKLTFKQYYDKWLKEYAVNNLERTTLENYKHYINTLMVPAFGHLKLSAIKPMHVLTFYNNLLEDGIKKGSIPGGFSKSSIKKIGGILSSMLSSAVQWQMISENPCFRAKAPKVKKTKDTIKFFTLDQVQQFIEALDTPLTTRYKAHGRVDDTGKKYHVNEYTETHSLPTQFKVFFYIALFVGLRKGEILALKWDDIDFATGMITVSKSAARVKNEDLNENETINKDTKNDTSSRVVQLPEVVMKLLISYEIEQKKYKLNIGDQWIGDNFLFIQWNGSQMHPSTPYHTFVKIISNYNKNHDIKSKLPEITLHG
jgi:integrase